MNKNGNDGSSESHKVQHSLKSKLPVRGLKTSDVAAPCAKKPCPQKPVLPLYSKHPNIVFSSTIPTFTVKKCDNERKTAVPGKKTVPRDNGRKTLLSDKSLPLAHRPVGRYRTESKLQDQIQLLEAANNTLREQLTNTQTTNREMSADLETMKEELRDLKQRDEKRRILLESQNIDPVLGDKIVSDVEITRKIREETKANAANLLKEFQVLCSISKEQKRLVQAINAKWKEADENRRVFLEEQKAFQRDLEKYSSSLEDAERWLDL